MGKTYANADILLTAFAISTQVHLMTGPGTSILRGLGRPREEFVYSLSNVAILAVALPLSYLLCHGWTTLGIAFAVAGSTVGAAAIFVRHANRVLSVSFAHYAKSVIMPGAIPYVFGLALAYPIGAAVARSSRFTGAAWLVVGGLLYTAINAFVVERFIWEPGERLWFRSLLASSRRRLLRSCVK
jgi:hypothetical protein